MTPPSIANPLAHAQFLTSAARLAQLPADERPEAAFAGRSNAGKSSAMNALCGVKQLARVSKTPGRTQLINLFGLPCGARLVDLPGYGYAEVPETLRRSWNALVGGYLESRVNLRGLILVMDIRHPLTALDRQMLDWNRAYARPVHVLLSKADKLGRGAARAAASAVKRELSRLDPAIGVQVFSALTREGVDEARAVVARWLDLRA